MELEKQSMRQVGKFLVYTFAVSWVSWAVIIIGNTYFNALWYGLPLFWVPMIVASLGPAVGAYVVYRQTAEGVSIKSFFKYLFFRKIDKTAWLVFISYAVWRFLMVWFAFGIDDPVSIAYMFINLPLFIVAGGLEEVGWRGYLQPALERKFRYVGSVLMVGVIWALWHLPLWLIVGTVQSALPFGMYLFLAIILSVTFTTIYKYTKSVLLCILSHAWFNGCIGLSVYIGTNGYLQLDLSWKVFVALGIELAVSFILAIRIISEPTKRRFKAGNQHAASQ